ncbi:hypothetical protein [Micromonospora arida]|uniref:hypothetical protein n=1 Tax=Micromonospora arida TaxID=2203715 RepID=UPI0033E0EB5A
MIEQSQRRVPVPVAVAAVILLVGATIPASARFWTTVFSTVSVGYGVVTITEDGASGLLQVVGAAVIVGLLLVPASSRRWFHDLPAEG